MLTIYTSAIEDLASFTGRLEAVAFDLGLGSDGSHSCVLVKEQAYLPLPAALAIHGLFVVIVRLLDGESFNGPRHGEQAGGGVCGVAHDGYGHPSMAQGISTGARRWDWSGREGSIWRQSGIDVKRAGVRRCMWCRVLADRVVEPREGKGREASSRGVGAGSVQ